MIRRFLRRRHHPLVWVLLALAALPSLDLAAALVRLLWPLLLAGAVILACRRWQLHLRLLAWLPPRTRPGTMGVPDYLGSQSQTSFADALVQGHVEDDGRLDRAELARLRDDNAKLRAKVRALSDMINGPEARP